MKSVLQVLQNQFYWLFTEGFRIVDSDFHESFGGQGSVDLASDQLKVRFASDRSQVDVSIAPPIPTKEFDNFIPIELFILDTTGRFENSFASESMSEFLHDKLEEIAAWFEAPSPDEFDDKLRRLEKMRAKFLFG